MWPITTAITQAWPTRSKAPICPSTNPTWRSGPVASPSASWPPSCRGTRQLFLSAVKLGPALAAGCTVVLKASEDGPAPLLDFAKLIHEAGFPPGVVNILTGFGPDCGHVLTTHPKVAHIAFTGGPGTARALSSGTRPRTSPRPRLELGGKSPFIVFADADLDSAANAQVSGIFAATGQSCVAGSRLIIQASVKDAFLAKLKAKAEAIRIASRKTR